MRTVWDAYYHNTNVMFWLIQGIIYVIDSTDFDNLEESKIEFLKLLKSEELKNAVILIYANKQDRPNAKSVSDLIQIYGLDKINTHTWHVEACSAKTGEGLMNGLNWLSDQLVYRNTRFPKNPYIVQGINII